MSNFLEIIGGNYIINFANLPHALVGIFALLFAIWIYSKISRIENKGFIYSFVILWVLVFFLYMGMHGVMASPTVEIALFWEIFFVLEL